MVQVKCFGNRGAAGYEPENTINSVNRAADLGADWILVNTTIIGDKPVAISGEALERVMGNQKIAPGEILEFLRAAAAARYQAAPLLEDVVEAVEAKAGLCIQIDNPGGASLVVREIHKALFRGRWKYSQFIVASSNFHELETARCYDPNIRIGCVILGVPHVAVKYAEQIGAHSVFVNKVQMRSDLVAECHGRGLEVVAHVVNSEEEYLLMEAMGVDAVVSDFPDKIVTWRFLRYEKRGFALCD
jgi:glycerophosphoryl diester phosphodiesterase